MFHVQFVNAKAKEEFMTLPTKLKAKMAHTIFLLENFGFNLGEPHSKKLQGDLFELRIKAQEGIARAIYAYEKNKTILILLVFVKTTQKTPERFLITAQQRLKDFQNEST